MDGLMANEFSWTQTDGSILTTDPEFSRLYAATSLHTTNNTNSVPEEAICITFGPNPREWWRRLASAGRVLPIFRFRNRTIVGPLLISGESTVCPTCVALRLGQAYPHAKAFTTVIATGGPAAGANQHLSAIAEISKTALKTIYGRDFRDGIMYSTNHDSNEIATHRVLPIPGRHGHHNVRTDISSLFNPEDSECKRARIREATDTIKGRVVSDHAHSVDPLVGPIISMRHARVHPDAPDTLYCRVALTGFLKDYLTWSPDVSGSGYYDSPARAAGAAAGEAAERYSGNYIDESRLLYISESTLRKTTTHEVLSPEAYLTANGSKVGIAKYDRNKTIGWVEGRTIDTHMPVYAAAETVFLNYTRWSGKKALHPVVLAGIAAGPSTKFAENSAINEIYERDASMRWWYGGISGLRILDPSTRVRQHVEPASGHTRWQVQYYCLSRPEVSKYVTACSVENSQEGIFTLGFACRDNLDDSLIKAGAEAWQLAKLTTEIINGESDVWRDINSGALPMAVAEFREDRRYKHVLDQHPIIQLGLHLQYFIDPDAIQVAKKRIEEICEDANAARINSMLQVDVDAENAIKYSFNLSTNDFADIGYHVVRVLCPGLVGNTPAGLVPWNHKRMIKGCTNRSDVPMPHA